MGISFGAGLFTGATLIALAGASVALAAEPGRTPLLGTRAFGDWQESQPGVWRLIRPQDIPKPYATRSASNAPGQIALPAGAVPSVPGGFRIEKVADGFAGPRVIRVAPNGDLFVADSGADQIHVLRVKDGTARPVESSVFASGLDQPYGIAFYPPGPDPQWVYVANTGSVVRFAYRNGDLKSRGKPETVVASLPTGGHWTRDLAFSPDGRTLYVSVGSASNLARQAGGAPPGGLDTFARSHALGAMWGEEEGRADVLTFNPEGRNRSTYATGIRNCSGLAIQPGTGTPWCVTNERDGLGDNLPPDYATSVEKGHFYGWPWYYIGANQDPRLDGTRPDLADKVTVPDVLFQAHSAPLGIAFYDSDAFGPDYRGDAFVTMHGSWNRGARTGYKVVRLKFRDGVPTGEYEDFVTGFVISRDQVWGRPVGVAVAHDGSLFITEDANGTVWRVSRE